MSPEAGPLRLISSADAAFEAEFGALEQRRLHAKTEVDRIVLEIVEDVRRRGDAAVIDAVERLDGHRLTPAQLLLTPDQIERGAASLDAADRSALALAADRVRRFHRERVPESWEFREGGVRLGLVR